VKDRALQSLKGFYVWDLEAYVDMEEEGRSPDELKSSGLFVPYACGFKKILSESESSSVQITIGNSCITEFIDLVSSDALDSGITAIYLYAHNAKKFDNYLLLNNSFNSGTHDYYKFKTVIKSGSGLVKVVLLVGV